MSVRAPLRVRLRAALGRAAPALALYAAIRLAGIACLTLWAWHTGRHPRTLLGKSWDSAWYLAIAEHGYGAPVPKGMWPDAPQADLAFFPLYPWLVRAVSGALPVGGITAGLLVAWAAAAVAAWGIFAVGAHLHGRRTGTFLVALWAVLPHAVIQSLGYTETLLTALSAWSLYGLLTGRPVVAGALAAVAGLARPSALAIVAAVWAAAVAETWRRGRRREGKGAPEGGVGAVRGGVEVGKGRVAAYGQPEELPCAGARTPPRARLWAGALIAPTGWLGYVLWVGQRTGDGPRGYFAVQALWGSRFDFGQDALRSVKRLVLHDVPLAHHMTVAVVCVALLLFLLLALDRPPPALLAYTAVLVVIALGGTDYFASKPRFLLPAFPLLLPAAVALARARTRTVVLTGGALTALSLTYGLYLLTVARMPL
ncbi:hypothetical protein KGS77_18005 [Streptomyces sp. MST-110588]|nr:hypothetical protein KGS77_18005 [Streptomyces sp. MST-110588]